MVAWTADIASLIYFNLGIFFVMDRIPPHTVRYVQGCSISIIHCFMIRDTLCTSSGRVTGGYDSADYPLLERRAPLAGRNSRGSER